MEVSMSKEGTPNLSREDPYTVTLSDRLAFRIYPDSRPTGLLILLPMLVEMLQTRRNTGISLSFRDLLYFVVPMAAFFSWLLYSGIMTNDWVAPFDRTAWDTWVALFVVLFKVIPSGGLPILLQNLNMSFTLPVTRCPLSSLVYLVDSFSVKSRPRAGNILGNVLRWNRNLR